MNKKYINLQKFSTFWLYFGIIFGVTAVVLSRCLIFEYISGYPYTTREIMYVTLTDLGSICAICYTILNGKKIKIALYFGVLHALFLGYSTFEQNVYATCFYYLFISFPLLVYGIINWNKNKFNSTTSKNISTKQMIMFLIAGIIIYIFLVLILHIPKLNARIIYLDSATITFNIFGTYFLTKRMFIQWPVLIITYSLFIIEYSILSSMYVVFVPMLIMAIVYLFNSILNLIKWKYEMGKTKDEIILGIILEK